MEIKIVEHARERSIERGTTGEEITKRFSKKEMISSQRRAEKGKK